MPGLDPAELKFTVRGASPTVGDALAMATGGPWAIVVVVVPPPSGGGVVQAAATSAVAPTSTRKTPRILRIDMSPVAVANSRARTAPQADPWSSVR